jgi:pimeloyl-ACP methyl ester carboxylesterase
MPQLEHQGRTLQFIDEGEGTPVVLLHSGGLSSRQWRALASSLRARHRVIAPDFIGYGGSSRLDPDAHFSFSEDVEMIGALLATLAQPAHLVGHSYGGLIALQAALRNPAGVRSLSLYEPVAFGVLHGAAAESESAEADAAEAASAEALATDNGGGNEAWLAGFVDWWQGAGVWAALPEATRANFIAVGRKTFLEVRSLLADRTPAEAYGVLEAPALLLAGARSPHLEQRVCARLATALPRAHLETLPTAGHMGPLTHMSIVNGKIAAHIGQSDLSAQPTSPENAKVL